MAAPPTLSEVVRRLDELAVDIRGLRTDLDKTYVRQDVYRSDQQLSRQEAREAAARAQAVAADAKCTADEVQVRFDSGELARKKADDDRTSTRRLAGIAIISSLTTPVVAALIARALS